jgi:SHS2 domain-containing protein
MKACYTLIEHPADLGIEAKGETLTLAFIQVAYGLISVIVDPSTVDLKLSEHIHLFAEDEEQLLVKWLSEILYLYDGKKFMTGEIQIELRDQKELKAIVRGEYFSESKHKTRMDVKAVTYHQLVVKEKNGEGFIRVFLDI